MFYSNFSVGLCKPYIMLLSLRFRCFNICIFNLHSNTNSETLVIFYTTGSNKRKSRVQNNKWFMDSGHPLVYDEQGNNFSSVVRLEKPLAVVPPENSEDSVLKRKEHSAVMRARERKRKASEPEQEAPAEHTQKNVGKRTTGQERKKEAQQYSASAKSVRTRTSPRFASAGKKKNCADEDIEDEEDASSQQEDSSDDNYQQIEEDTEDEEDASSQPEESSDDNYEQIEEDSHSLKVTE